MRGCTGTLTRLLENLRRAFLGGLSDELSDDGIRPASDPLKSLPDPPHLEPGDVRYGNGVHDYF